MRAAPASTPAVPTRRPAHTAAASPARRATEPSVTLYCVAESSRPVATRSSSFAGGPMTMTIERGGRRRRGGNAAADASASQRLRTNFAAARVSFTWFGVRKGLSAEQKTQAAESFGAEGQFISAAKKLLDT